VRQSAKQLVVYVIFDNLRLNYTLFDSIINKYSKKAAKNYLKKIENALERAMNSIWDRFDRTKHPICRRI